MRLKYRVIVRSCDLRSFETDSDVEGAEVKVHGPYPWKWVAILVARWHTWRDPWGRADVQEQVRRETATARLLHSKKGKKPKRRCPMCGLEGGPIIDLPSCCGPEDFE